MVIISITIVLCLTKNRGEKSWEQMIKRMLHLLIQFIQLIPIQQLLRIILNLLLLINRLAKDCMLEELRCLP